MTVNKVAINVLLSVLDIEQRDLADQMGYGPGYIANVLNGFTDAGPSIRRAFGETLVTLLLGPNEKDLEESYPGEPLIELVERHAAAADCKQDFYRELGTSPQALRSRKRFNGTFVDRICCALGVHPSEIYGFEAAS